MQVLVNFRQKGNPHSGIIHTEKVRDAQSFFDALAQAREQWRNKKTYRVATWHSMLAENGIQVTLANVRAYHLNIDDNF